MNWLVIFEGDLDKHVNGVVETSYRYGSIVPLATQDLKVKVTD